jgi:hypothetical protein
MKAVVFRGKCDVRVEAVPDPHIEHPADAIVRGHRHFNRQLPAVPA